MKKSAQLLSIIFASSFFLLACALLPFPNTTIETPQPPSPAPTTLSEQPADMGLENENLLAELPDGFKVGYEAKLGNVTIREMVHANESVDDWSALVTVQIFSGITGTTPEQYQEKLTQAWFSACTKSESYPVADGEENGYPFVLWELYCPLNPSTEKVEYAFVKAMQGKDSFYLVQVAFRHDPTEAEITQWMQYLKQVRICDTRIPDQACP